MIDHVSSVASDYIIYMENVFTALYENILH